MSRKEVFILDDDQQFLDSTAFLLDAMGYRASPYSHYDGALEAMAVLDKTQPACLLLDIRMPDKSGLDVHDLILQHRIDLPIIYMTAHGDIALAVTAMQKGALTFLEKPLNSEQLQSALDGAFCDVLQSRRLSQEQLLHIELSRDRLASLTPRETEVASGIVSELANKQIASRLNISVKTVELHRSRVMAKMECKNAAQLVRTVLACEDA